MEQEQNEQKPYMPRPLDNLYKRTTNDGPNKLDGLKGIMDGMDELLDKKDLSEQYKQQGGQ